jgi:hypothetical protein
MLLSSLADGANREKLKFLYIIFHYDHLSFLLGHGEGNWKEVDNAIANAKVCNAAIFPFI